MTGGYIFTLCVNPHLEGVPDPALDGGDGGEGGGGYLIQPWTGGREVPDRALDWGGHGRGGVPDRALDGGGGGQQGGSWSQ